MVYGQKLIHYKFDIFTHYFQVLSHKVGALVLLLDRQGIVQFPIKKHQFTRLLVSEGSHSYRLK